MNSSLRNMKRICVLFSFFLLMSAGASHAAEPAQWSEEWRACEADTDCTVIEDVCKRWKGVNRRWEAEAIKYFQESAPIVECPESFEKTSPPGARCENNLCEEAHE